MNKILERLETLNKEHDLSYFYCITIWPATEQIALQGYFNDTNCDIAKHLDLTLTLENNMLRGKNEYYTITLTT